MELLTPSGKPRWNVATVRGILKNPAYTGTTYANRTRPAPAKRRKSALLPVGRGESHTWRPREEWIPIPVPAIVEQAMFEQVQAKLAQNRQGAARNNKRHQYLLRALVSCGKCRLSATGRTMPNPSTLTMFVVGTAMRRARHKANGAPRVTFRRNS